VGRLRIGVDVGGTFTDVVAIDEVGTIAYAKVSSTPEDQSAGVMEGLRRLLAHLGARPEDIEVFVHGTTVATNTLLERTGARVGLLTTRGFRDVLHIGRQSRPHLYDLHVRRPMPLVPRRFRREVRERTVYTGDIELPVDPAEVQALVHEFAVAGIEAVAICFLHAYANPLNERRAAEAARSAAPELPLSISSEILPEIREFERMNTTVLNAYVQPAVGRYVQRLAGRLQDARVPAPLHVMRSNGGVAGATQAYAQAVQTLLSGPAGGVLGAAFLSEVTGLPNLITAMLEAHRSTSPSSRTAGRRFRPKGSLKAIRSSSPTSTFTRSARAVGASRGSTARARCASGPTALAPSQARSATGAGAPGRPSQTRTPPSAGWGRCWKARWSSTWRRPGRASRERWGSPSGLRRRRRRTASCVS